MSPTANQYDAIAAIELALADYEAMFGHPLVDECEVDPGTGEVVKSPGQNGSRERGFGTLKYERLFLDEMPDAPTLIERAENYRAEFNTERPHEAITWNQPIEVHLGLADPTIPTFEREEILPTT